MARALMIQGTGSNVGKSMVVAGLARACANRGIRVLPFKPQNMSNNAAVAEDGGEIGRAQALQALAARVAPHTDMNPVLLKPQSEKGAQLIVQGKVAGFQDAARFGGLKDRLLPSVLESFSRLSRRCDLVLVEGAGSPAETNLRARDIANMGFARAAGVPVVLLGDIDRGGVIAQIVGTQAVLSRGDSDMIKGFIVNKFRGDVELFSEGCSEIVSRTGWPCHGVLPWFTQSHTLPAEDIMDLARARPVRSGGVRIAVPHLPRLSNFDDLDPLIAEPDVTVDIVPRGAPLPGDADVILLAGSKATIADLSDLRSEGWDIDIAAHVRRGGHLLGICGGYQMLGQSIADPYGVEGSAGSVPGLGYLRIDTMLTTRKHLARCAGRHIESGAPLDGYEIHMGESDGPDCARPWLEVDGKAHGASSPDGRIRGCYLHGIFGSDAFRAAWLAGFGAKSAISHDALVDRTLDALADHLEQHLDIDQLLSVAAVPVQS